MKKLKYSLFLLVGIIGCSLPISLVSSLVASNQKITIDGKVFNNMQSATKYVNEMYGVKNVQHLNDQYYIEENGKKVYLGQTQVNQLADDAIRNSETKTIYSTTADIEKNLLNPSIGELSPQWFSQNQIEPGSSINIYKGDADITYLDQASALDSFMSTNQDVYFFNNIYFRNTSDLRQYLTNIYFKDQENTNTNSFRIKAPNGEYSNIINLKSKSDWKSQAISFVEENCQRVIKIKTNDGYRYFSASNEKAIDEAITFEDVPYIKVNANQGKMNFVIGLNEGDGYELSGPSFYTGYADVAQGMTSPAKWTRLLDWYTPNYTNELQASFDSNVNAFFEEYVSKGQKTVADADDKDSSVKRGNVSYNLDYLFEDVTSSESTNDGGKSTSYLLNLKTENDAKFVNVDKVSYDFDKEEIVTDEAKGIAGESFYSTLDVIGFTKLSTNFKNYIDQYYSSFSHVYDDAVKVAENYSSMKNYNAILKIPLLFSFMMDKFISGGADEQLIQVTRNYFSKICDIYSELILTKLGPTAFKPAPGLSAHGDLDLKKLFGINSKTIEFDIQKYYSYITSVYPSLITSSGGSKMVDARIKSGLGVDEEAIDNEANYVVNALYQNAPSDVSFGGVLEQTKAALRHNVNKAWQILSNEEYLKEMETSDIKYAAFSMIVSDQLDTSTREAMLDDIELHAQELLNSPDTWEFVPNDNKFKRYAFFIKETQNINYTPNDILLTINTLQPDSLIAWINAIDEVNEELFEDEYQDIAKTIEKYDPSETVDYSNDTYNRAINSYLSDIYQRKNDYQFSDSRGINFDSMFEGIYLTFDQYVAITIMRMLGDLAQKDSLFIMDKEQNAVVINPEFKTQATKIILDAKQNNPELMIQLTHLYRGFEAIQQKVSEIASYYKYQEDVEWSFDDETIDMMLKNTAQYASIINQNLEYFQQQLTNINVPLRTGQIIAYTGTSTELYTTRDNTITYDLNVKTQKSVYESGSEITPYEMSYLTKVDKTKPAYVIPNVEVVNNEIKNVKFTSSVYVHPTYDYFNLFEGANKVEYTFDKFLDTELTKELNINSDCYLYFNPLLKYDDHNLSYDNFDENYTYIKKWGYNVPEKVSNQGLTGTFNENASLVPEIKEFKIPKLLFSLNDDKVVQDESINNEESINKKSGKNVDNQQKNTRYVNNNNGNLANEQNSQLFSSKNSSNQKLISRASISDSDSEFVYNNIGYDNVVFCAEDGTDKFFGTSDQIIIQEKNDNTLECFISDKEHNNYRKVDKISFLSTYVDGTPNTNNAHFTSLTTLDFSNDKNEIKLTVFEDKNYKTFWKIGEIAQSNGFDTVSNIFESIQHGDGKFAGEDLLFTQRNKKDKLPLSTQLFFIDKNNKDKKINIKTDRDEWLNGMLKISGNDTDLVKNIDESEQILKKHDNTFNEHLTTSTIPENVSNPGENTNFKTNPSGDTASNDAKEKAEKNSKKFESRTNGTDSVLNKSKRDSDSKKRVKNIKKITNIINHSESNGQSLKVNKEFNELTTKEKEKLVKKAVKNSKSWSYSINTGFYGVDDFKNRIINGNSSNVECGIQLSNYKHFLETYYDKLGKENPHIDLLDYRKFCTNYGYDYYNDWDKCNSFLDYHNNTEEAQGFRKGLAGIVNDFFKNYPNEKEFLNDCSIKIKQTKKEAVKESFKKMNSSISKLLSTSKSKHGSSIATNAVESINNSLQTLNDNNQNVAVSSTAAANDEHRDATQAFSHRNSGEYANRRELGFDGNVLENQDEESSYNDSRRLSTSNNDNQTNRHLANSAAMQAANMDPSDNIIANQIASDVQRTSGNSSRRTLSPTQLSHEISSNDQSQHRTRAGNLNNITSAQDQNMTRTDRRYATIGASSDVMQVDGIESSPHARKKGKFMKVFKAFATAGSVLGALDFAMMVGMLAVMIIQIENAKKPRPCAYEFKADNYEWQWSGGLIKNPFNILPTTDGSQPIDVRTASEMYLNTPIKINNSYVRDSYYYGGKLYDVSEQSRNEILNQYKTDLVQGYALENTRYGFNDLGDKIINDENSIDEKLGVYSSTSLLANSVINDIESNSEESKYIIDNVKSFSDGFGGEWSSVNSDAAIQSAVDNIVRRIRPTAVLLKPIVNEYGLLDKSRTSSLLPGSSYDAQSNKVVSEEDKQKNNTNFNTHDWFIINDSANLVKENGDFVNSNSHQALANAKAKNIESFNQLYFDSLETLNTYNVQGMNVNETKFSVLSNLVSNLIRPVEVLVYSSSIGTKYFVETTNSNTRSTNSIFDNLLKYLMMEYNIKLEIESRELINFYQYEDMQFASAQELINYLSK